MIADKNLVIYMIMEIIIIFKRNNRKKKKVICIYSPSQSALVPETVCSCAVPDLHLEQLLPDLYLKQPREQTVIRAVYLTCA